MTEREGAFTIPTRVFLSEGQRAKLQQLVLREGVDLPELLTELLARYLDELPDSPPVPTSPTPNARADIAAKRAELARLRTRKETGGAGTPAWLDGYIADLEAEIRRMSEERGTMNDER